MALLPVEPRQRKQMLLLMGAIVLAGWYASRTYFTDPHQVRIQQVATHLERLESRNQIAKEAIGDVEGLQRQLERSARELRIFEAFIPRTEEVPELLDAISREAQLVGVELTSIRPSAPGRR